MRIVGGRFKGRRIIPPSNLDVRPTTDFAKEALFNILYHRELLEGPKVLELFAGTGNITFEFISQGAAHVTAVEKDARKAAFIQKTATTLQVDNLNIRKQDVKRFLEESAGTFDIIFADPPFDLEWITAIPEMVFRKKLLATGGWLIVEHGKRTPMDALANHMETRTYGNVNFSFFQNPEE